MACEKCGFAIPDDGARTCPVCGTSRAVSTSSSTDTSGETAWTQPDSRQFDSGFIATTRTLLLNSGDSLAALSRSGSASRALVYALIAGSLGMLGEMGWRFILNSRPVSAIPLLSGMANIPARPEILLIITPIAIALSVWLGTVYTHIALTVTRTRTAPWQSTFRVICYAHASLLLSIIPLVGDFMALVWGVYLTVLGLARTHRCGVLRIAFSLTIPMVLLAVFIIMIAVVALTAGLFSGAILKDALSIIR